MYRSLWQLANVGCIVWFSLWYIQVFESFCLHGSHASNSFKVIISHDSYFRLIFSKSGMHNFLCTAVCVTAESAIVSGSGGLHVSSLFHRILFGPSVWIGWSHFSWFSLWLDLTVLRSFLYWVWMVWYIRPSSSTHRCGDTFGGGWVLYCAVFDVQKVQENTRNSSVVP